jgi:hypothetical protein
MADAKKPPPKSPTLKALRALARKHLGTGHSKLKTKEELLRALHRWLPSPLQRAMDKAAKPLRKSLARLSRPSQPKTPRPLRTKVKHSASAPVVEGFFVARVVSEGEARRHHLTEARDPVQNVEWAQPGYDERLGELPDSYGDDAMVALPRDPQTLFVFWDFNEATRRRAADGLVDPRAMLRVFDGEKPIRELDFALESKSFYVHGLPPGRSYRVEALFVGRDGRSNRIGHPTHAVELPRRGPSEDRTVRFLRLPWGLRLSLLGSHLREGRALARMGKGERAVGLWRRVPLPGSGSVREDWAPVGWGGREAGASETLHRR